MKSNQKNMDRKESHLVGLIYLLLGVIIGTLLLQIKDLECPPLFPLVMYITTWFIVIYDITAYIRLIDTYPYSGRYGRFAIDVSIFVILFVITISQSNLTLYLLFLTLFFSFIWSWHRVGLMQYNKNNEELKEGKNDALIRIFSFAILTIVYGILSLTKYSLILSNYYSYIFVILIWFLVARRYSKIIEGKS